VEDRQGAPEERRVKRLRRFLLPAVGLVLLATYLLVTGPSELPDDAAAGATIPAETALALLDAESAAIRTLYAREIVGEGSRQKLAFNENWRQRSVAAGPVPAQLLRVTAQRLQARVPGLTLSLGSDFPLLQEDLFTGAQAALYQEVKKSLEPRFHYDPASRRTTAMFPDRASTEACVNCHNRHPGAAKQDWVLSESMGATVWSYSGRRVTPEATLRMLDALRESAVEAYGAYLQKVAHFEAPARPAVGELWPRDGFYLPDQESFRQALENQNSAATLNRLFAAVTPRPVKRASK